MHVHDPLRRLDHVDRFSVAADEGALDTQPDMQIARIRLSDKTSRLHPRHVVPKPA
jgi:hypothetical protein